MSRDVEVSDESSSDDEDADAEPSPVWTTVRSLENEPLIDDDVRFVGDTLGLSADNLLPSLHLLSHTTATQRLVGSGHTVVRVGCTWSKRERVSPTIPTGNT